MKPESAGILTAIAFALGMLFGMVAQPKYYRRRYCSKSCRSKAAMAARWGDAEEPKEPTPGMIHALSNASYRYTGSRADLDYDLKRGWPNAIAAAPKP